MLWAGAHLRLNRNGNCMVDMEMHGKSSTWIPAPRSQFSRSQQGETASGRGGRSFKNSKWRNRGGLWRKQIVAAGEEGFWLQVERFSCFPCECGLSDEDTPLQPSVFQKHNKQVCSHRCPRHRQMLARSALGLVDVYNLLPNRVVEQKSVPVMQHELPMLLKFPAANGEDSWRHTFSPRVPLSEHPLHLFSLRLRHASFLAVALQSLLVACG